MPAPSPSLPPPSSLSQNPSQPQIQVPKFDNRLECWREQRHGPAKSPRDKLMKMEKGCLGYGGRQERKEMWVEEQEKKGK